MFTPSKFTEKMRKNAFKNPREIYQFTNKFTFSAKNSCFPKRWCFVFCFCNEQIDYGYNFKEYFKVISWRFCMLILKEKFKVTSAVTVGVRRVGGSRGYVSRGRVTAQPQAGAEREQVKKFRIKPKEWR
jgi:hypothetical protein